LRTQDKRPRAKDRIVTEPSFELGSDIAEATPYEAGKFSCVQSVTKEFYFNVVMQLLVVLVRY